MVLIIIDEWALRMLESYASDRTALRFLAGCCTRCGKRLGQRNSFRSRCRKCWTADKGRQR